MINTYSIKKDLSILNAKWLLEILGSDNPSNFLYTFIGRSYPWSVDSEPPMPVDNINDYIQTWKDIISLKRVQYTDITLAIRKILWVNGTVYDMYDDKEPNINDLDYYVITSKNKVYKCLDNNNGSPSTEEPDSNSLVPWSTTDGYKWQLMYIIDDAIMSKWSNDSVIPVTELKADDGSLQWSIQESAIPGTIDCIQVTESGSGYLQAPTVSIIGDGTGATATAILNGDKIERIRIDTRGEGYTYAIVNISGNAQAEAIISPIKGHGSNAVEELNGRYIIVRSTFDKTEEGTFPVDISFRQIGLLLNPTLNGTDDKVNITAGALQLEKIETGADISNYIYGEQILNQSNNSTAYLATTLDNSLYLTNINGKFNIGDSIIGVSSGSTSTITGKADNYLNLFSGSLLYVENRSPIMRAESQTETYKIVIAF